MGAKDAKSKEYLADNTRFADLFNYKLYDGEQVILPEDLQERDSTEILSVFGVSEEEVQEQKWRDLLKSAVIKSTQNAFYVLLGVENQTDVHYAMPVRNMLYDALNYGKQVNEAKKRHIAVVRTGIGFGQKAVNSVFHHGHLRSRTGNKA